MNDGSSDSDLSDVNRDAVPPNFDTAIANLSALAVVRTTNTQNIFPNRIQTIFTHFQKDADDEEPNLTAGRAKLQSWLYRCFRIVLTDGRILNGTFLCTDADANIILGMCTEDTQKGGEERMLGLVMVPGRHIVKMEIDVADKTEYNKQF